MFPYAGWCFLRRPQHSRTDYNTPANLIAHKTKRGEAIEVPWYPRDMCVPGTIVLRPNDFMQPDYSVIYKDPDGRVGVEVMDRLVVVAVAHSASH